MNEAPILEVRDLSVRFSAGGGLFGGAKRWLHAVESVSFSIAPGEIVGLVGESGCGKTTLGRTILRLTDTRSGSVLFKGTDVTRMTEREFRPFRKKMQMIFQDPFSTLNPRMTAGESIGEALDVHGLAASREIHARRIAELLESVGLPPDSASRYPDEFSGGQRQRIGIARALAVEPELILCDEPVSALDVSVQAQVINLLRDLSRMRGIALLFISHDLAVVRHLCSRILVMYLGRVVESGPTAEICESPAHPYTRALLASVPKLEGIRGSVEVPKGEAASPISPPPGCAFHTRCPEVRDRCRTELPVLHEIGKGRCVACHFSLR
jgi:oligopeptide/dipeptide ABC transporter ATP-binding protein